MESKTYGYVRISTAKQNPNRQIENIKRSYPDAVIVQETYTGTTTARPAWTKLYKAVKEGDTIVFDEVSRMSRNAEEGYKVYEELYKRGVNLVFLKEMHINTSVYKKALDNHIDIEATTGRSAIDKYISGQGALLNDLMMDLAKEQIELAFASAQAEVDYLHQRTKEGMATARLNGKQIGRQEGTKVDTKKSQEVREAIQKYSKDFGGTLSDVDVMKLVDCARNTYYKCKAQMKKM